jgi:hypothetical protein
VTGKQTPPKTEAKVQERMYCSYDKADRDTVLLTIILPPVIVE